MVRLYEDLSRGDLDWPHTCVAEHPPFPLCVHHHGAPNRDQMLLPPFQLVAHLLQLPLPSLLPLLPLLPLWPFVLARTIAESHAVVCVVPSGYMMRVAVQAYHELHFSFTSVAL